ncbi:ADP-ribosylation factor-like protein 6-interacting protein 6 [Onthophagus taurus]|uniref:ADP-ribosylation factor-like protein 6-interacting protein 6 n=1 Tax=Onthophagus taurus TaxID=166361 RepID=UPI0039BDE7B0
MSKNSLNVVTPRRNMHATSEFPQKRFFLSERKLAVFGLIVSVIIVGAKVCHLHRDHLKEFFYTTELKTENVTENGEAMIRYFWRESIKYSSIWLPILCGLLTTYFTGIIVFLDSDVPGVQPPSPFSPSKYRKASGHTFHSNYAFALLIGITVTCYMYWRQFNWI